MKRVLDEKFMLICLAYLQKKMYAEAEKQFLRTIPLSTKIGGNQSLAILYALSGKKGEAARILNEQLKMAAEEYVSPYTIAQIYSVLNDREQAFGWLEKGFESRDAPMTNLDVDPFFDNLRSDPRFSDLKRRMGLWL